LGLEEESGHVGAIPVVIVIGLLFGLLLYYLRLYMMGWLAEVFLVTVLAFIVSSWIAPHVIRGSKGAVQIPLLGHLIQPKAYVFLVFFIFVCLAGILIDRFAQFVVGYVQAGFSDIIGHLIVGLILAFLVYADLEKEYYDS